MTQRGNHDPGHKGVRAPRGTKRLGIVLVAPMAILLVLSLLLVAVSCGGDSVSGPEAVVQKFFTAMENKDIDAIFELWDPQAIAELESQMGAVGLGLEDAKVLAAEELFAFDSMEFSNVKLKTEKTGEGEATVTVVEGTITQTSDGVTETLDAADFSGSDTELYLYQVDGKWYIDFESM